MSGKATLYRAEWVLPVATPPIPNGEILVGADGRIAAVAPARALDLPADIVVVDLGRAILLPGLVNVHAHPELAMFRGALEDLPFREWILRLVGAKRAFLSPEDTEVAARWTMVEAIRAGITTIGATEASGAAVGAMTQAGLRGIVYQEVFGPDPTAAGASLRELELGVERLRLQAGDRVRVGVSPHAPYTVSDPLYQSTAEFARRENLPVAMHIAESPAEHELVVNGDGDFAPALRTRGIATPVRGRTPIDLLRRLDVLDTAPLLIHCVDLDDADIAVLGASGAAVAHCPVANAKLGHGVAPVTKLRDARVRIGLGTDSVASNNRLDLLEEARVAALLQRALNQQVDLLSAPELLRLCTVDGARALGLDDRIGTLEPGKDADFCAVSLEHPSSAPNFDPVVTLFHSARGTDVTMTVVAGQVLYASGKHTTLNADTARSSIEEVAERLRAAF
jgi:cytosine/adenosine deaminase-related metal-dependent hydrolase